MSLIDDYNAIEEKVRNCTTCDWYSKQTPEVQTFFDKNVGLNRAKMWRVACKNGLNVAYTSFRDHFNNGHHQTLGNTCP